MTRLDLFHLRMNVIAKGVEDNAAEVVRKAALAVEQTVVLATPVDTGRARANWLPGIGSPVTKELASEDKSGSGTIAAAAAVIATYKPQDRRIYISNNVSYVPILNTGSSAQAPANFVEKAVIAAARSIRNSKLLR